ncbi:hypothetical protein QL285_069718 [Trifolium repens]|nr:hypothetical protein QL285_069718 [Trifolium repens]
MAKPKITNKGKIPPISDRLQARFSRVTDKSGGRHIRRFCRLKLDKLVLEKDLCKEENKKKWSITIPISTILCKNGNGRKTSDFRNQKN